MEYRLPARYFALLSALAERWAPGRAWLGDVGFDLPAANVSDGAWLQTLSDSRWRGMHPDLVPFAEDGFGNRFCFVRSGRQAMRGDRGVVYWMYETYRAVPVSSTFDGFVYWVALTAWVAARKGDPVIDEDHVDGEVIPLLSAIGLSEEIEDGLETSDPDPLAVNRAVLRLDPEAPGPRVAMAHWLAEHDRPLEALDACAEAYFAFPDFAGARAMAARVLEADGGTRFAEALVQTLQRPFVYSGDEAMPYLRDVPRIDLAWTIGRLSDQQEFATVSLDDPLWTLVLRDDPVSAQSWVQLSLDYAQEDELEAAVTAACNALLLGFNTDLGPEIHGLLVELYAALDWSWHVEMASRWAPE